MANDGNLTVALDVTVTDELHLEGIAREIINRVQNIRLDPGGKGINVSKTVKAQGGRTLAIGVLGLPGFVLLLLVQWVL